MQYTIGYHMQNEGYPVVYPYIILMHGHPIGYPICCLYMTLLCLQILKSLNNNRSVMSKLYAWLPLALLPTLKASACTNPSASFLRYRRLDLHHRSLDHVIEAVNLLCDKILYIRYADNMVRKSQAFLHFLAKMVWR